MQSVLKKDMEANFRWHSNQPIIDSLTIKDFFDETVRDQHLARLMNEFGSPTRAHAASMTAKRLGYAVALMIYARTKHEVLIHSNECTFITITEESTNASWHPIYSFPLKTEEFYQNIVDWITKDLYAQTLVPLVELLAQEKGISRVVLFENICTYIKWIFITKLQDTNTFQQLIDMPASEYGVRKQHPLAIYQCDKSNLRKTCCLYYQTTGAVKSCSTCPL
jgi:ferric iron reductase protein FhuF